MMEVSDRLNFVEGIFEEHQGKNFIFDQMKDKIATQEGQITEFKAEISGAVKSALEKQEMI